MEAQFPPSKIARVADTTGTMEEGSSLIGLGLGLGPGLNNGKPGFTFLQLQELEQQALIFKYMVTGVSVPFHLVFPIWKSVVSSFGGVNGGIYQQYPNFLGCSSFCLDYRNSMEPEPGRCRRTDGKKWRCSKDVVPDQKYCERHMHRGRNRSRKHVEASSHLTTTTTATTKKTNYSTGNSSSSTNLSISDPVNLQLVTNNNNNGIITSTATSNSNYSNVSSSLGFSPKSVLQSNICKTESPPL
ncbi:growth-regulating factor 10-like [Telopea speciosissima]|uniref:growth-regulating factor 10-like n=1 Tax=Telopea speciosissima TaxID=54955 RepID=UPI001CC5A626|nr:growth-regulating factor 10-like [Telopea speciosissima]